MAKTKATKSQKNIPETSPTAIACGCCHHTTLGRCWMCWLFKSLIVLFCAFLLIWVGFCVGILRSQHFNYRMESKLTGKSGKVCMPMNNMSHGMSSKSMEMMGDEAMATLQAASAETFDKEFLIQMIVHHESGVEMAKLALEKSQDAQIRTLAQEIIDKQTEEINQMKEWSAQ